MDAGDTDQVNNSLEPSAVHCVTEQQNRKTHRKIQQLNRTFTKIDTHLHRSQQDVGQTVKSRMHLQASSAYLELHVNEEVEFQLSAESDPSPLQIPPRAPPPIGPSHFQGWIKLLLQLLLSSKASGVTAVTLVTQRPPVVTVRTGQTVSMDCNLGTKYDKAVWYKQVPGGVPQFVLRFFHNLQSPIYGSGFSAPKFTSTHQSQSDYRLIINNVEEGDSAVYYCSSSRPPVLKVFPPSRAELQSNTATLVCLSSQSGPYADVSWSVGGSPVSSGILTSIALQQADQTFQISSYLSVKTSDWNMDKVYTCKVSLGSQSSEKSINKSDCPTEE
ncbi:hypothetical protein Q8A73_002761 [Channa argus]|nr:hypothetical protein Q8A73_002761 [Channa argus]